MDETFWLFLIFVGGAALFVGGVLFHKYVISEADTIKQHVTAEIAAWRVDVAKEIAKAKEQL